LDLPDELSLSKQPPTPHVHWHFRPRYDHVVKFAGIEFIDQFFGQHYDWPPTEKILDDKIRKEIIEEIQKHA